MTKEEFVQNANTCYAQYRQFMNHNQLPTIQYMIHSQDEENLTYWGKFISEDLYNKIYTLHISDKLLTKEILFQESILFHEFTHLYDSLFLLNYPIDDFKTVMKYYSEYHAEKIKLMKLLEYGSMCDKKCVYPNQEVLWDNGYVFLYDYILNNSKRELKSITSYFYKYHKNVWDIITYLMNSFGCIDLINSSSPYSCVIYYEYLPQELQSSFMQLYTNLQEFKYSNSDVSDILAIEQNIVNKFRSEIIKKYN